MMTKKKRIISLVVAVAFFFVVLYSALYIAAEANHDCVGENCPICYQISVCENTLKNLSLAVSAAAFAAAFTYSLCRSIFSCAAVIPSYTLVSLKVKLTD